MEKKTFKAVGIAVWDSRTCTLYNLTAQSLNTDYFETCLYSSEIEGLDGEKFDTKEQLIDSCIERASKIDIEFPYFCSVGFKYYSILFIDISYPKTEIYPERIPYCL